MVYNKPQQARAVHKDTIRRYQAIKSLNNLTLDMKDEGNRKIFKYNIKNSIKEIKKKQYYTVFIS